MAEIEKLLEVIHKQQTSKAEEVKYVPFCRVDVVTPGSPADASNPTKIVVERYVKGEVCTLELEILSMILPNNTRYLG
ncbi:hypothetical protein AX774_g477 [Zancudomyces culisetae]|uniref:Uncharacterized protein n=1 Tax=Zancudomyces culisetae TaxID=1213189 RepID=A0A1R1PYE5_ZANCU|nr:hypothetical protein AX774_g477 [Zancudomyces culisetae]|eukprot:OMH85968.1 hypothetical protein AX774_g477 [Zancudomyces culisetae]